MAIKKTKKEKFNKKLFECNFIIVALSIIGYLGAFLADASVEVSCTEWCNWDLRPFVYTWITTTIVVFIIEMVCYVGLIKESPKKINKKNLVEYNIVGLFGALLLCLTIFRWAGLLIFILGGGINLGILIGTTLYLVKLNKKNK